MNQPEHYTSCLQVKVVDGGSGTPGPVVQFPGAYTDQDEYANFNIYTGFQDFPMPGPAVWSSGGSPSGGSSSPEDVEAVEEPSAPVDDEPASPTAPDASCSTIFGQCGGNGYSGSKCCSAGKCQIVNEYYSQCV